MCHASSWICCQPLIEICLVELPSSTIVGCRYVDDMAGYHLPTLQGVIDDPPIFHNVFSGKLDVVLSGFRTSDGSSLLNNNI